MKKKDYLSRLH
jgi:hypothetical protein